MSTVSAVFLGPNGLRAGWRLLIFFAILVPLGFGTNRIVDSVLLRLRLDINTPLGITVVMAPLVVALLLASWIMAQIEGRSRAEYGLPWRRAFCGQFWQGAAISFASITALLFVLRLAGAFSFGPLGLQGSDILKYGIFWMLPVFLGTLLEDFFYRGYLLFTLTLGVGFWPAAVATSFLMGGAHYFNPGGHGVGPFAAFLYCMVTALVMRRTGDLWMALGIHAAWDWGEVFFYGVPSSGQVGRGHLLSANFHGPVWLTGGAFGPEASWPSIALLVVWGIFFSVWLREAKYPNAAVASSQIRHSSAAEPA